MRILVVEDEVQLAEAVARGLRREGMAVDVATDGDEGYRKAALTRYDVVVLDRDLPGMSGDEICRKLTDEGVLTRVMMLTASGTVARVENALAVKINDYRRPDGTSFYAPDRDPAGPQSVAPFVDCIVGLTNATAPESDLINIPVQPGSGENAQATGLQPNDIGVFDGIGINAAEIQNAYGLALTSGDGPLNGSGQTVAVVIADDDPNLVSSNSPSFNTSDLHIFDQQFGLPDPPSLTIIQPAGPVPASAKAHIRPA